MMSARFLVRGCLYALLLLLPFLASLREIMPIVRVSGSTLMGFSKEIVILFLFSACFLASLGSWRTLKVTPALLLVLAFIAWGSAHLLSLAGAGQAMDSWRWQYLYPVMAASLLVYGMNFRAGSPLLTLDSLAKIVVLQAAVVSAVAIVEILHPDIRYLLYGSYYEEMKYILSIPGFSNVRSASTLGNPINLGVFLLFALVNAAYLAASRGGRNRRLAILAVCLACLGGIVLTLSRTAYLILGILALVQLLASLQSRKLSVTTITLIGLVAAAVVAGLPWLWETFGESLGHAQQRLSMLAELGSFSEDPRVENWRRFLAAWSDNWVSMIWGAGLGLSNSAGKDGTFIVENSFVSILGELGLVGLILYLLILASMLRNWLVLTDLGRQSPEIRKEARYFGNFLVLFLVCSLSIDAYRNSPFSAYFWILFAYGELRIAELRKAPGNGRSNAEG